MNANAYERRYNFDGFVAYSTYEQVHEAPSYTQLFHNCSIESVWTYPLMLKREEKKILISHFETVLINKLRFYLHFQKYYLHVEPPIYIMLSLIGVLGYNMPSSYEESPYANMIDRDILAVPEKMIEKFEIDVDIEMKDVFDMVWNAAGWPSSPFYDASGKRKES